MTGKILLVVATVFLTVTTAKSQGSKEAKFGVDSVQTVMKASLYQEAYNQKNYKEAYPNWKYVVENAPNFQLTTFSRGNVILKNLYNETKDKKYLEELMDLWDKRMQYWSDYKHYDTDYCKGRKGYDMYNYMKSNPEKLKEAYELMTKSIDARGVKSEATVIDRAMIACVELFKANKLQSTDVVNDFIKLNSLMNEIYDTEKKASTLEKIGIAKNNVQVYFITSGAADCGTLQEIFTPKYEEVKDDAKEMLNIVRVLNRFDCTESDLYDNLASSLHALNPTAESALAQGVRALRAGDKTGANSFFQQAISLETDKYRQADIHMMMGKLALINRDYSKVRSEVKATLALNPDLGKANILLAKAYFSSAKGDVLERSKAIWAAVDVLGQAAKDPEVASEARSLQGKYSAYYPGCEDLFFHGISKGDSVPVGGWIGGSTTVRCK